LRITLRLVRHISYMRCPAHLKSLIGIVRWRGIIFCKSRATSATVRKTLVSVAIPGHSNFGIALNRAEDSIRWKAGGSPTSARISCSVQ